MDPLRSIRIGIGKVFSRVFYRVTGTGLSQEMNTENGEPIPDGMRFASAELDALIRRAGAESCVLLKNDGALPLKKSDPVAVLGRCQYDWFYTGYGSGGDVHAPYHIDLIDGLKNAGAEYDLPLAEKYAELCASKKYRAEQGWWGHWPFSHPEFTNEIREEWNAAVVRCNEEQKDGAACIVVIGRAAGEDRDNTPEKGSWLLTDRERELLDMACAGFDKVVVVLNIGSLMDLSWIEEYGDKLSAVLIAWLGGQESGNAVCDVLYGSVSPCGRLPDTAAKALSFHPSAANFGDKQRTLYEEGIYVGYRYFDKFAPNRVLFPFGHGLSYSEFAIEPVKLQRNGPAVLCTARVKNTGKYSAKCSVLMFVRPPEGDIDKPEKVLAAFSKTPELAPGESAEVPLYCGMKALASFDEEACEFVLEPGEYRFEANGACIGSLTVNKREVPERCKKLRLPPEKLRERILSELPAPLEKSRAASDFNKVLEGKQTVEAFVSTLNKRELEALTRGHGMMNSPLGPAGNAAVFGGVIPQLREKGVPAVSCCDGPSGLRIRGYAALIPCGTALAATFDTALVSRLHELLGRELAYYGVGIKLTPGMNIHRHPLCGRNFEYFSEDPTLSGLMGSAVVKGLRKGGGCACPKHFACNNQEESRNVNDSVVSERALREIYLRNFELCVKDSHPEVIMTSYNKINGVWAHYNYELVTAVLRGEWGFKGAVMTDWWMKSASSPEFPKLRDNAYRVRAQVDLLMPGDGGHLVRRYRSDGTLLKTLGRKDGITTAELQRSAVNVLKLIVKLKGNKQ